MIKVFPAMTILEEAFQSEGYTPVPFLLNGAGHPTIVLRHKETDITFLLDTGASGNFLDVQFAKDIGLGLEATEGKGGGAGGLTIDVYMIGELELQYEELVFSIDQFMAMDFSTIKQSLEYQGIKADFQGILGFGFFEKTKSYIDYGNKRIYVRV